MRIDDFLRTYVEGYLFEDLASMARVGLAPGKAAGAVGYPMVATALAGIELLGYLVQITGKFRVDEGEGAFERYWTDYLYPSPPQRELAWLVYRLLRDGLTHVFFAKPGITVTKNDDPARHLRRDVDGALLIDALVLQRDLQRSYETKVRPRLGAASPPNAVSMQDRLDRVLDAYRSQVQNETRSRAFSWEVVPLAPPPTQGTQVNSPTVHQALFSSAATNSPAPLPIQIIQHPRSND